MKIFSSHIFHQGGIVRLKKRIGRLGALGIGHTSAEILNHAFDVALYPVTVWFLGPLWSTVVMVPLSLFWDYGVILLYNNTKKDWLGFESLRQRTKSFWVIGALFIFFAWWDPPRAFVLVRGKRLPGQKFNTEDWRWFITSNLIGNALWILMLSGVFGFIRSVLAG